MAGVTSSGLQIKTRSEIYESIQSKLKSRIDPLWDDVSNNTINIISNIFAEEMSDAWGGLQSVYDASYPKSAYGVSLDNVSDLVNVRRIGASKSSASLQFTGTVGSVVPEDTVVTVQLTNERFVTASALTLSSSTFSDIKLEVSVVNPSTDYTIIIDGDGYTFNSGLTPTENSILSGLLSLINTGSTTSEAELPSSEVLRINVIEPDSVLPITVGAGLSIIEISNVVLALSEKEGNILAPENTITNLLVPVAGITSVTNLQAADVGRLEETDSELRARRYESVNIVGASTNGAITSNVRNLDGVISSFIIENDTFSEDDAGRPPKSFEVVVDGGDPDSIAAAIWKHKPVGIETFGTTTRTTPDDDGIPRTVKFSRPVDVYVHMQVEYKRYTEEPFSATAVQGIKDSIVSFGNSLNIGSDIIPDRFLGSIYGAVSGLGKITIRVAKSYDGMAVVGSYTEDQLMIDKKEIPIFQSSLISVTEV